jgi:hypothetical protein
MNEQQRLFLVQARTDFAVFELFQTLSPLRGLPACHSLHYLQMATELLGKARAWRHGRPDKKHRAFVVFLRSLRTNRQAQKELGYQGQNANWQHLIRKSIPLAEAIEDLAPALALDGANPEYPWPPANPFATPAEHTFALWRDLQDTAAGRQFLHLTKHLFSSAEAYL